MFQNFYGLEREPFHITPDPSFLYLSASHKEALASVIYGVEKRKGFIAVIGEVGLGKTTILRSYLERVDPQRTKIIYLFNANISFTDLLKTVYRELGLEMVEDSPYELVNNLHQVLIDEYRQGRNVVLIVDEVQNMPIDTLENLRMLSNLETARDKLIQILLIGQPEFEGTLSLKELRQLRQRIAIKATIHPLTQEEGVEYIKHRLAIASPVKTEIFTPAAIALIARYAKGIPRVMNIIGNLSLIAGLGYRKKPITPRLVKEVIADYEGKRKKVPLLRWASALILVLILVGAGVMGFSSHRKRVLTSIKEFVYHETIGPRSAVGSSMSGSEEHDARLEGSAAVTRSSPKVIGRIIRPENNTAQAGQSADQK